MSQPRRKKKDPVVMPDMSEGGTGVMGTAGGGSLNGGRDTLGVVLNLEVRTKKTTELEDITLPECFRRDQDRFDTAWKNSRKALELRARREVAGKLTIKSTKTAEGGEVILGYLPCKLARQTLHCDLPGKARVVYRFEFSLKPHELVVVGEVLTHPLVVIEFEPGQTSLATARDLEADEPATVMSRGKP